MNITEIAEKTGITLSTLSKYKKGSISMPLNAVVAFCIGMRFQLSRSLYLINSGKYNLTNSIEHRLYLYFLGVASVKALNVTVDVCSEILESRGFKKLN